MVMDRSAVNFIFSQIPEGMLAPGEKPCNGIRAVHGEVLQVPICRSGMIDTIKRLAQSVHSHQEGFIMDEIAAWMGAVSIALTWNCRWNLIRHLVSGQRKNCREKSFILLSFFHKYVN